MNLPQLTELIARSGNLDGFSSGLLSHGFAAGMGVRAGQQFNQMTVFGRTFFGFNSENYPDAMIRAAMGKAGNILEQPEIEKKNENEPLWASTRAGWLWLNPALICVVKGQGGKEGEFCAYGFAKEGLISQKTAQGAVKRFQSALENQSTGFQTRELLPFTRINSGDK